MNKQMHFYVSRKNRLTWLMALCMVTSAAARVVIFGMKGTEGSMNVWVQIVLPVVSTLLYAAIALYSTVKNFFTEPRFPYGCSPVTPPCGSCPMCPAV